MATKTKKSTIKSSAKSSGLKTRFNLANRKVQFFVFIAIVALLGGGYFTIKSFAAIMSWSYYPSNFISSGGWIHTLNGACQIKTSTDPAKNNISVWDIGCKNMSVGNGKFVIQKTLPYPATTSGTYRYYRVCVNVKGAGSLALGNGSSNTYFNLNNNGNYNVYCSNERGYDGSSDRQFLATFYGNTLAKMSKFTIEQTR